MKIEDLKNRLVENSFKKVLGHGTKKGQLTILVESEGGEEEFVVTENEDGTVNMESDRVIHENVGENDIDQLLEANTVTKDTVTKKELAQILTINNVKGRNIKEADVPDSVLSTFNDSLKGFAKKHKNFDLFDDEYTGKETDEFVDMLVSATKGTKVNLFEDGDELVQDAINSDDPVAAIDELKENIPLIEARSKRNGGAVSSKLKEALGSPFKTGDLAFKLRKGIPLKESLNTKQIWVVWGASGRYNGRAIVNAKSKNEAEKVAETKWLKNGKVVGVQTLEEYMSDLGWPLSYLNDFIKEELYGMDMKSLEKTGSIQEIEWGS